MPSAELNLETRIKTLNTVLTEKHDLQRLDDAMRASKGDLPAALTSLKGKFSDAALQKVELAQSLADWSEDHLSVMHALVEHPEVSSLRDVALHFNLKKLTALVDSSTVLADSVGVTVASYLNRDADNCDSVKWRG